MAKLLTALRKGVQAAATSFAPGRLTLELYLLGGGHLFMMMVERSTEEID
jgi:hypothetical protein